MLVTVSIAGLVMSVLVAAALVVALHRLRQKHRFVYTEILKTNNESRFHIRELRAESLKNQWQLQHMAQSSGVVIPVLPSQHGEEIVLQQYFQGKASGYFIEAGALDGINLSNTWLYEQLGWQGLLVEAHPGLYEQCKARRAKSAVYNVALGAHDNAGVDFFCAEKPGIAGQPGIAGPLSFSAVDPEHEQRCLAEGYQINKVTVPMRTLNALLVEQQVESVDFLSLDIEGAELEALQGFDLAKYRPQVLLIESNTDSALAAIQAHVARSGYVRVDRLGDNYFYVPETAVDEWHQRVDFSDYHR